jgi:hypothetical protein
MECTWCSLYDKVGREMDQLFHRHCFTNFSLPPLRHSCLFQKCIEHVGYPKVVCLGGTFCVTTTLYYVLTSQPYVDIQGTLLEGPFYDGTNHEFRFVDIWQQKLHILDLARGPSSLKTLDTPDSVGYGPPSAINHSARVSCC